MDLQPEQESLLATLVEAVRSVPPSERHEFTFSRHNDVDLIHGPGSVAPLQELQGSDLYVLRDAGLIGVLERSKLAFTFYVTPHGFAHYGESKRQAGEPAKQVQQDVGTYLAADRFRGAYPEAYARWQEAAELLWGEVSERELSTIGHKCREAVQEFATALVERHRPPSVNPDKTKTLDRLSSVLELCRPQLGETRSALLDALFAYWRVATKLVERQEHAGQREGEPLGWEDGRRVVFQTAVVMFEIDRTI